MLDFAWEHPKKEKIKLGAGTCHEKYGDGKKHTETSVHFK